jgi:hypothetical protein
MTIIRPHNINLVTGFQSYDQVRDGIATMSTTTKKTCALLLAALTAPALFAAEGSAPLQENTAKGLTVYDSQGKASGYSVTYDCKFKT